jgi:predicted DCC family thiol-disulfide oxidoreductase YuxK
VEIRPWQASLNLMAAYGLTAEDGMTQVWYINDSTLSGGAEAVNDVLRLVWWARPFTYLYRLPVIHQLQDRVYRWVANNRHRMPGSTAACEIKPEATK